MPFNAVFSWFIKKRIHQIELFKKYPMEVQQEWFDRLVENGAQTTFGKAHGFSVGMSLSDFKKNVPVRNYEALKPYINRVREGEPDVLWPTKTRWFAKSSGTTDAQSKYIPVTKEALEDCHYKGGKDLLAMYYHNNPDARLITGKHFVVGGTSKPNEEGVEGYSGDLSAIIIQNLPLWVEFRRTPALEIALHDNWEEKIDRMAYATMNDDVAILAGVPSWTLLLLKRILEIKGVDDINEVWPNLELFMHGGVSFKPYRAQFESIISSKGMNYVETYNASEGFFGIQDRLDSDEMLLMLDYGIYYEFVPLEELGKDFPITLTLQELELGHIYAIVISSNAGLWRYLVGDTVRVTSTFPFRIQVAGRTKLFINAFGEEVVIDNAEDAIANACRLHNAMVNDYTVCPIYMSDLHQGGHEWLIEFSTPPASYEQFMVDVDNRLKELNSDYAAKRAFDLNMGSPTLKVLAPGTFYEWLKSKGKLGGQHKVPRLSNDRNIVESILQFSELV